MRLGNVVLLLLAILSLRLTEMAEADCHGACDSCNNYDALPGLCASQSGCAVSSVCAGACDACSIHSSQSGCENVQGCSWTPSALCLNLCTACGLLDAVTCALNLDGCVLLDTPQCVGTCTECTNILSASACSTQVGCSWNPGIGVCEGSCVDCDSYNAMSHSNACEEQAGCLLEYCTDPDEGCSSCGGLIPCLLTPGCLLSPGTCSGACDVCSTFTAGECTAQPGCGTTTECGGVCSPCTSFGSSQALCAAQSGCYFCGDGTLDPGEECDDGNAIDGDGCSSACVSETCGDGIQNNYETDVDCGGAICTTGCATGEFCNVGSDCANGCCSGVGVCVALVTPVVTPQADRCGSADGAIVVSGIAGGAGGPYTCSFDGFPPVVAVAGTCSTGEVLSGGQTLTLSVSDQIGCALTLPPITVPNDNIDCPSCGDGSVDPGEQCDDGNTISGDGCSSGCLTETCGDGLLNNYETDADCGGPVCAARCGLGQTCSTDSDCANLCCHLGFCTGLVEPLVSLQPAKCGRTSGLVQMSSIGGGSGGPYTCHFDGVTSVVAVGGRCSTGAVLSSGQTVALSVSDQSGCTLSLPAITVLSDDTGCDSQCDAFTVDTVAVTATTCTGSTGTLTVSGIDGAVAPYSCVVQPSGPAVPAVGDQCTLSGLSPGAVEVQVRSQNGCTSTVTSAIGFGDSDSDGSNDCEDQCPFDSRKTQPGVCGCGVSDATECTSCSDDACGQGTLVVGDANSTILLGFEGSPSYWMQVGGADLENGAERLLVTFRDLEERRPGGSVVRSLPLFNTSGWTRTLGSRVVSESSHAITARYSRKIFDSGEIELLSLFFDEDAVLESFGGTSVLIEAPAIKFTMRVRGWPFASETHRLRLTVDYWAASGLRNRTIAETESDAEVLRSMLTGNHYALSVTLAREALVDAGVVPVAETGFNANAYFWTDLPAFTNEVVYDPNLSLLFFGGDDEETDMLWVYLAIGLMSGFLVVGVVFALLASYWRPMRKVVMGKEGARVFMLRQRSSTVKRQQSGDLRSKSHFSLESESGSDLLQTSSENSMTALSPDPSLTNAATPTASPHAGAAEGRRPLSALSIGGPEFESTLAMISPRGVPMTDRTHAGTTAAAWAHLAALSSDRAAQDVCVERVRESIRRQEADQVVLDLGGGDHVLPRDGH